MNKKFFLLFGVCLVLAGGLYLNSAHNDEMGPDKDSSYFFMIQGDEYPISYRGFNLSNFLKDFLESHKDEEDVFKENKVTIKMDPFFETAVWGKNIELEDFKEFADLLQKLGEATSPETVDLSEYRNMSLERLFKLIILTDFFAVTKFKILDELISEFAKKIKPELTDKNLADFFAGKENVFSKVVDGLPEGPSRMLFDRLFSKQEDFLKVLPFSFKSSSRKIALSGERLAVEFMDNDRKIEVWDALKGKKLITLDDFERIGGWAWLSEKNLAIIFIEEYESGWKIGIWDTSTGKKLKTLEGLILPKKIAGLPDKKLAIGYDYSDDNENFYSIDIWDTSTDEKPKTIIKKTHTLVHTIAGLPGKKLAIGYDYSDDNESHKNIDICDLSTGKKLGTIQDVPSTYFTVFSGERALTYFWRRRKFEVLIWDLFTGKRLRTLDFPSFYVERASFSRGNLAIYFYKEGIGKLAFGISSLIMAYPKT